MRKPAFLIGVFLALVLITPAASQQTPPAGAKACLDLPSFTAHVEAKIAARFAQLDTNHDGCLSREELQAGKKK